MATGLLAGALTAAAVAGGGTTSELVGHASLLKRLGTANAPTGAGVIVGHVEPPQSGHYEPNTALNEFAEKSFTMVSGTTGGVSAHATNVARRFYSNNGIAPDIGDSKFGGHVYVYSAGGWMQTDYLRTLYPPNFAPLIPPPGMRIFNNSWIASGTGDPTFNEILRRADFAAVRDDVLIINGENNGSSNACPPIMVPLFNGIAVGIANGGHSHADTIAGLDSPGRMNPQLVAPESATSYSAPIVAAGAGLMYETAAGLPLASVQASRSEVIKAVLMAGATHEPGWTNNPVTSGPMRGVTARPLDDVFGAGTLNVDRSHRILTAGEQDGALAPPGAANALPTGWDLVNSGQGQSTFWRFVIPRGSPEVSILATWHRNVTDFDAELDAGFDLADFDLELWEVGDGGELLSLIGDDGVAVFNAGNVLSNSAIDNVEHLYISGIAPGEYVIELRRVDLGAADFDAAVAWRTHHPADIVFDGHVNILDLLAVLSGWGVCDPVNGCPANTNDDDLVDIQDLLNILAGWG